MSAPCIFTDHVTQDKCADITEHVPVLLPPITVEERSHNPIRVCICELYNRAKQGLTKANSFLLSPCSPVCTSARNASDEMLNRQVDEVLL